MTKTILPLLALPALFAFAACDSPTKSAPAPAKETVTAPADKGDRVNVKIDSNKKSPLGVDFGIDIESKK